MSVRNARRLDTLITFRKCVRFRQRISGVTVTTGEVKMKALDRCLLLLAASVFLFAGCEGDDGAAGQQGDPGTAGAAGVACWDLDEDGVADPEEDLNGDGNIDVLDCREPLPGEEIAVSGKVSTPAGPLDRFVAVWFMPEGGGDAITADVAADGSYEVALDEGDYDAYASRPGYEQVADAITVTQAGPNVLDFSLPEIPDGEYLGSEQCGVCHTVEYASFAQTGHPFKLNKVVDGQQPIFPFTTLNGVLERITDEDGVTDNTLGTPATWDDVSYVIGGYFWKARFVDLAGAIVTGTGAQYNFETDAMASYNDGSVDKPYNCGNCHTTGWQHTDAALNPTGQDGLTFMQGTFFKGGIQCESCHAAGVKHAKLRGGIVRNADPRTLVELTADDAGFGLAVACGECHTRDGERDYPTYMSAFDNALAAADPPVADTRPNEMGGRIAASGGFVRHHEQYDEILGIDPETLLTTRSGFFLASHGNCGTCHNPHASSVNANNTAYTGMSNPGLTSDRCLDCHENYDPALREGGMQSLECADCHMPKLAKSAVVTIPAEADRPAQGDVTSHIFTIELNSGKGQFWPPPGEPDAEKFAYPAIDEDWACRTCHNSAPNAIGIVPVSDGFVDTYNFHNNIAD